MDYKELGKQTSLFLTSHYPQLRGLQLQITPLHLTDRTPTAPLRYIDYKVVIKYRKEGRTSQYTALMTYPASTHSHLLLSIFKHILEIGNSYRKYPNREQHHRNVTRYHPHVVYDAAKAHYEGIVRVFGGKGYRELYNILQSIGRTP